ncbi:MAG: hypothetical protein KDE19_22985 [Caldilineaceae bacterium]|nr:hypothetical protein [Caldilineaceae bacterium]
MTVHFSRSVRSIQADNLGPMVVGAAFFAVLMLGWVLWFFFATVPYFETSTTATYQPNGYIMAEFSESAFGRLRRGQSAQFLLATDGQTAHSIPLVITDLYAETAQARLILRTGNDEQLPLQPGVTGQVKVTTEQLSPARIVLRSAGLFPDS